MEGVDFLNSRLKKKITIMLWLLVFFMIIVLNLHRIRFALDMYNIYSQEKKTNIVSENNETEDKVEIYNPLTSIIEKDIETENDNDNDSLIDEEPVIAQPVVDKDTEADNWPNPKPVEQPDNTKPYVSIIKEYNEKLESLRGSFESKLDNLISQGIAEYQSRTMSTAKLSSKYLSAGTSLERTSDSEFNTLVKEMEWDLKSNNHDVLVVKEIKEYYNDFKSAKKHEVISRGMKYLR